MRVAVHVRPRAARASVGGELDGALVIRVREPATGGKATTAALAALARALGVPARDVTLVHGATTRRKLVEVDTDAVAAAELARRLRELAEA